MFDNSTLEAYRAVKAPDGLRERVISSAVSVKAKPARTKVKPLYTLGYALAACLVLAVSLWGFAGGGVDVAPAVSGEYGISLAREITLEEVGLELDQRGFCRVSVSDGVLKTDTKYGNDLILFGAGNIVWELTDDDITEAELTVVRAGGKKIFLLQKNADSGEWEICPAEINNR